MAKTTRKIKAQSLRGGMTIEMANGSRRKVYSPLANGKPRINDGTITMFTVVLRRERKPGIYDPKTGQMWDSFEAVLNSGQVVETPFDWIRYGRKQIRRPVRFELGQTVRVVC
jgi:hypothetical protein